LDSVSSELISFKTRVDKELKALLGAIIPRQRRTFPLSQPLSAPERQIKATPPPRQKRCQSPKQPHHLQLIILFTNPNYQKNNIGQSEPTDFPDNS
jgi:hypothetical protein